MREFLQANSALLAALATVTAIVGRGLGAEELRLPIARDTWFSNVGNEADCNTGGASKLKLKSIQEMSLLDVDPAPLRGRVIRNATLHLRAAGKDIARRVTVGTFASPWVEGTAPRYQSQAGSSTHNARQHPDEAWAFAGSDMTAVMLGQGGTIWRMADASPPDLERAKLTT